MIFQKQAQCSGSAPAPEAPSARGKRTAPLPAGLPGSYPTCPRVAVGAIVFHRGRVLLVCRRHPPGRGLWAIPGGRVELGESLAAAAEREILEETGLAVRAGDPVEVFEVVERDDRGAVVYHYVIVDLAAEYLHGDIRAGDDALEARWVPAGELARLAVNPKTRQVLRKRYGFG